MRPGLKGAAVAGLLTLSLGVAECADKIVYGQSFDPTLIDRFEIGATTRADVVRMLGAPRGRGDVYIASLGERRDMLFYERVESDMQAVSLKFLLIILDGDRYDGHFWFSSTEIIDVEML